MDLAPFRVVRPEGEVEITLQVVEEDARLVCGIKQVAGHIPARPKAWLRAVRETVATIESKARDAGCQELRITGRDWSRVLPDYEHFPALKNGLRKAL